MRSLHSNELVIGQYYKEYDLLRKRMNGHKKFLGIDNNGFLIFDATNNARCHTDPNIFLYFRIKKNNYNNLNMLIIQPNNFDPVTYEDIEDGDRVVLINNDKRFMFKENVFNTIYNNKQINPFTNEFIDLNQINRYIVIVFP
jgi:hypothetical protein